MVPSDDPVLSLVVTDDGFINFSPIKLVPCNFHFIFCGGCKPRPHVKIVMEKRIRLLKVVLLGLKLMIDKNGLVVNFKDTSTVDKNCLVTRHRYRSNDRLCTIPA